MTVIKRIAQAHKELDAAKKELEAARIEAFPIGSAQEWLQSCNPVRGVVLDHGGLEADRIYVRSFTSGKEYWTSTYNMAGEEGGPDEK